jgi:peptidoglycan hydrolase-like protein with peptidoglycan-binding domain
MLTRDLYRGMSGEDVRTLQGLLNTKGYTVALTGAGSPGNETIYFGPATEAAVIRFQIAHGISPAVGYVGPITRAALASL